MYSFFSCFRRFIYVAFPQVGVLTIYERQSDNSLNAVQVRATIKHYEPALAHSARILMILQVTLSTNSILNFGHECCSAWTSALKFETLRLAHVALVMKIATIKLTIGQPVYQTSTLSILYELEHCPLRFHKHSTTSVFWMQKKTNCKYKLWSKSLRLTFKKMVSRIANAVVV